MTDLERFLRAPALRPIAERLFVFESSRAGRSSYAVLLGDFDNNGEALTALRALPPDLLRHRPHIRSVKEIRAVTSESKT